MWAWWWRNEKAGLGGPASRYGCCAIWRARDGAQAVETALLLPLLFAFLFGIEEIGRGVWTQAALQFAVEAAARCAATNPTACSNVPAYAATQAMGLSVPSSDFTYTASNSCGITSYTTGSKVSVSYTFQPLVPQIVPGLNVTLTASACHP